MKAFIAGGLGFVGRRIAEHLLGGGHEVVITDLMPAKGMIQHPSLTIIRADSTQPGPWQEHVATSGMVINLAGASIFGRWTKGMKTRIYDSRVLTTRNIVDALPSTPGTVLYSTSAQGYYGFHGDEILTEKDAPGDDFLATVCRDWEAEAMKAREKGVRVVTTRFGIVLGRGGGVLGMMVPLFRLFAGGRLGTGTQWFSWIHIEDLVRAYIHLLSKPGVEGPVNFCSPAPVTNGEFAKALGKALHRPSLIPAPAFAVRLLLGEFGDTILNGQRISPEVLLREGYSFTYPDIESALRNIIAV
jgi:hypothetical protein